MWSKKEHIIYFRLLDLEWLTQALCLPSKYMKGLQISTHKPERWRHNFWATLYYIFLQSTNRYYPLIDIMAQVRNWFNGWKIFFSVFRRIHFPFFLNRLISFSTAVVRVVSSSPCFSISLDWISITFEISINEGGLNVVWVKIKVMWWIRNDNEFALHSLRIEVQ